MRVIIAVLILASFLQTTILPINLVMLILVLRSFIVHEKNNLYLAFGFGLLISHLSATPLGVQSLVFLIAVIFARVVATLPISNHILVVLPLIFISSLFGEIVTSLVTHASIQLVPGVVLQTVLAIPLHLVLRFWEERFIVSPQIKLKI